jgi:hypothetical protein
MSCVSSKIPCTQMPRVSLFSDVLLAFVNRDALDFRPAASCQYVTDGGPSYLEEVNVL